MEIKPLLYTTLADDVPPGPQGQPGHKKGASIIFNSFIKTSKLGELIIITPNPIFLYMDKAENLIAVVKRKFDEIKGTMNSWAMFSSQDKNPSEYIKMANKDELNKFIEEAILIPILLFTSVEAFINQIIPEDFIYIKTQKRYLFFKKRIELNKSEIVKRIGTKEKLSQILKQIFNKDITEEQFWGTFLKMKKIRDEIVHLKQTDKRYIDSYNHIFISLIDSDFEAYLESIKLVIRFYKPDFFAK